MNRILLSFIFAVATLVTQINKGADERKAPTRESYASVAARRSRPLLTVSLDLIDSASEDAPIIPAASSWSSLDSSSCAATSSSSLVSSMSCHNSVLAESEEPALEQYKQSLLTRQIRQKAAHYKKALIAHEVDINSHDEKGKTFINTLITAIWMRQKGGIDPDDFALVYAGLALGADVNKRNKPKYDWMAADDDHTPAVIEAINCTRIWAPDPQEEKEVKRDLVFALIRAKADIFAGQSMGGKNALEQALANSDFPVVSYMFAERYPEIRQWYAHPSRLGKLALDVVDRPYLDGNFCKIMKSPFTETERTLNDAKIVQLLAEKKADLSASRFGRTVLEFAHGAPQGSRLRQWAMKLEPEYKERAPFEEAVRIMIAMHSEKLVK